MGSLPLSLLFADSAVDDAETGRFSTQKGWLMLTKPASLASANGADRLNPPIFSALPTMEPPPENQYYDTSELGIASINAFARGYGYAVSTRSSKTTKLGIKKTVRLCCDRGRRYRPRQEDSSRVRKTQPLLFSAPLLSPSVFSRALIPGVLPMSIYSITMALHLHQPTQLTGARSLLKRLQILTT